MEIEEENDPNAKNTKKGPYLKGAFETFVLWSSLSPFRGKSAKYLRELGSIGDENEEELINIKTKTEFAQKYGIKDLGTLTDWSKRIREGNLEKAAMGRWTSSLTKNVIAKLYIKIMEKGDASRVKLWMQIIEGWKGPEGQKDYTPPPKREPIKFSIFVKNLDGSVIEEKH